MEHRYLGDNSVTEGFAFLFEHLTEDPAWLERRLGIDDPGPVVDQARASKLVFLRRYCAKLAYELELHGRAAGVDGARRALRAAAVRGACTSTGPTATWLSDVDPFFYVARYLRAWALETHLRRELRERFGEAVVRGARARASCCASCGAAGQRERAGRAARGA